jgi:S-adenosyl-L-methionine hydrolase (adenosine-forming)
MKGVIWGIAPQVKIADITHAIRAQDVLEGALVLDRTASFFPAGTIHLAVVDPGVGTKRRPIAAQLGDNFFVGPDNGLCSLLLSQAQESGWTTQFVHLDRPKYWLAQVSNVFHGRDIFAPIAAHLANGVPLGKLGSPMKDPILLSIPTPEQIEQGWCGQVILVDNFGNLSTNLTSKHLMGINDPLVKIAGQKILGLAHTFGSGQPGELVALIGEAGDLCVAVVNGNASESLGVTAGEPVEVREEYLQDTSSE